MFPATYILHKNNYIIFIYVYSLHFIYIYRLQINNSLRAIPGDRYFIGKNLYFVFKYKFKSDASETVKIITDNVILEDKNTRKKMKNTFKVRAKKKKTLIIQYNRIVLCRKQLFCIFTQNMTVQIKQLYILSVALITLLLLETLISVFDSLLAYS